MSDGLRDIVKTIAVKGLIILDEYFDGRRKGSDKVKEALKMVDQAIKVEHMDQIRINSNRSFGLRLLQFLPKDEAVRRAYIIKTNPDLKPLLLDKPK